MQRKYQLRKVVPGQDIRYLAVGKRISAIKGTNKANKIRLRAFNLLDTRDKDDCRLLVYVNGKRLAVVLDKRSGSLQGRETAFSRRIASLGPWGHRLVRQREDHDSRARSSAEAA